MKYALMNYALGGGKLTNPSGTVGKYFPESCRHEQMTKSLPHVVVVGFGYMDLLQPNFTSEEYTHQLASYIQQVQNLPSKPIVMLTVPVTDKQLLHNGRVCRSNINDPYFPAFSSNYCSLEQRLDMQETIYKAANLTGIPDHHVVNSFALLRLNRDVAAKDYFSDDLVHPNAKGMGVIAQDMFMKMSLSPEILERENKVKKGEDEDWNNAVRAQLE